MSAGSVRFTTLLLALGVLTLAGAGAGAAVHRYRPRSPVAVGVKIDERRVPDGAQAVDAWLLGRREAAAARTVRFRAEGKTFEATFEAAGISLDVEATLAEAERVGHEGTFWHLKDF